MNDDDYYTVKSNNAINVNAVDKPKRFSCSGAIISYMNVIMIPISFLLLMNSHQEITVSIISMHSKSLIAYAMFMFALLAVLSYKRITIAIPNKNDNFDKSTVIIKIMLSVVLLINVISLFFNYQAFTFIISIILLEEILMILPDELSLYYQYNESTEELLKPYRKQQQSDTASELINYQIIQQSDSKMNTQIIKINGRIIKPKQA